MSRQHASGARSAAARWTTLGIAAALALTACSGKNIKPGTSLSDAEAAVARAERARVGDYDPSSWKAARENLARARASFGDDEANQAGRWFAARAKADADLGIVRAERARLAALTAALKREIATLSPPPPAPPPPADDAAPAAATPAPEATP